MIVQCDWLSGLASSRLAAAAGARMYDTGKFCAIAPDGELKVLRSDRVLLEGSHDSRLWVSSPTGTDLFLSGNPVKFFQGHNLFGSSDVHGLFFAAGSAVRQRLGLFPSPQTYKSCEFTHRFSRIDLTRSFRFASDAHARAWLRTVGCTARTRHGGALMRGDTVYFGKSSRRWSFKLYLKSDELQARSKHHHVSEKLSQASIRQLHDWSVGVVRFELTLRGLELKDLVFDDGAPGRIWESYFSRILLNRNTEAGETDMTEQTLPQSLRGYVARWRFGEDLRATLTKPTYYRVRRELLDHLGIDIAVVQQKPERDVSRVVCSSVLDSKGWDPEPIEALMYAPDSCMKKQYGLV